MRIVMVMFVFIVHCVCARYYVLLRTFEVLIFYIRTLSLFFMCGTHIFL